MSELMRPHPSAPSSASPPSRHWRPKERERIAIILSFIWVLGPLGGRGQDFGRRPGIEGARRDGVYRWGEGTWVFVTADRGGGGVLDDLTHDRDDLRRGLPAAATRALALGNDARALERRDELRRALARRRDGAQEGRRGPRRLAGPGRPLGDLEHRREVAQREVGALAVALVDDEDVGDLEQPRLERLHAVAEAGRRHDDDGVGHARDVD